MLPSTHGGQSYYFLYRSPGKCQLPFLPLFSFVFFFADGVVGGDNDEELLAEFF